MAHPTHSNVTLRFKLIYTNFTIEIPNFNIQRNGTNVIHQLKTHVSREMGINDVQIILAGEGENSFNRNIENNINVPSMLIGEVLYLLDNQIVEFNAGVWTPLVNVISFYVSPRDNRIREYLRNNAPNPNVDSLHSVMYIIHQVNTDYEGASADTDDDDSPAAGGEAEPPPEAAASPTSVTINTDNNTPEHFQGECCVCYTQTTLSHHYSCNLTLNNNHGLCNNCWNQWRNRNNTCPVCRAPPGTPSITESSTSSENPQPMDVDINNNVIAIPDNMPDDIRIYVANRPVIRIENNGIVISNVDYNVMNGLANRLNIMNQLLDFDNEVIENNRNYILNTVNAILNNALTPYDFRSQT